MRLTRSCIRSGHKMGMVFQSFNLFPHFTVLRNLTEAPIHVLGKDRKAAETRAMELLSKVGLADKRDAYPYQLSGGQRQRVAIARALAMEPEILCFDEPTSALDPELTLEVLEVIRDLASEHMTMIVVTHAMSFARDVASRVVFMASGHMVEERHAGASVWQLSKSENASVHRTVRKVIWHIAVTSNCDGIFYNSVSNWFLLLTVSACCTHCYCRYVVRQLKEHS